jgi:streptogramin lyase
MRKVLVASVLVILTCLFAATGSSAAGPNLAGLQLVTQLPWELPQRITGLAYDGKKLWATVYHGGGRYATFDPASSVWTISSDEQQHRAITKVSGSFSSPGAISFVNGELWVAGSYGDSFGSIDIQDWKVKRVFKGDQREDNTASQHYSSMAFDGAHLWIAWHWCKYKLPVSETQLLLKIELETGKVVAEYPLPAGTRPDVTHALTWDGSRLWHAKDNRLSSIDPSTGQVTAQYVLPELRRPSGLAWDGQALWIAEFEGKIWRLPF